MILNMRHEEAKFTQSPKMKIERTISLALHYTLTTLPVILYDGGVVTDAGTSNSKSTVILSSPFTATGIGDMIGNTVSQCDL